MMDYVNYRRFKVIKTKSVTIRRTANFGTVGRTYLHELGAGQVDATTANTRSGPMIIGRSSECVSPERRSGATETSSTAP
jgi:hypothetical protein